MRFARLLPAALLTALALPALAAPIDFDAGLRASIWKEDYKLGVGGELGAVAPLGAGDLGLHLMYNHFAPKSTGWSAVDEMGGYLAWYFLPAIDQLFKLRIGPHIGGAYIDHATSLDLGGDADAVFDVTQSMRFYAAFVPSFFIGKDPQSMFRVGLGVEFHGQ